MNEYYYLDTARVPQGPHTPAELAEMMANGRVNPTTLVACKGAASWEPLGIVLSRENITAPEGLLTSGKAGQCPSCGRELTSDLVGYQLPTSCPFCVRALRPEKPGIWSNFCFVLKNYAKFSGRATRAEYWSFQLVNFIITFLLALGTIAAIVAAIFSIKNAQALEALETAKSDHEQMQLMLDTVINSECLYIFPIFIICLLLLVGWLFFTFIPSLSVFVRRLHDAGWSGWWFVVGMAYGFIVGAMQAPINAAMSRGVEVQPSLYTNIVGALELFSHVLSIFFLVLTLLDSKRGANKYGPSSKYPLG